MYCSEKPGSVCKTDMEIEQSVRGDKGKGTREI